MYKSVKYLIKAKRITAIILVLSIVFTLFAFAKSHKKEIKLPDTSMAEIYTNRLSQFKKASAISVQRLSTTGYEKTIENNSLAIFLNKEDASLRIIDKNSGYVWGMLKTSQIENLNDYWTRFVNSLVTLEYYDSNNNISQISMSDERVNTEFSIDNEKNIIVCQSVCEELGLDFSFELTLNADNLEACVTAYKEYGENKISKMYILPFLGSTAKGEMDGYIFIPDGSGALMRFNGNADYEDSYAAKIYGYDIGIDNVNKVSNLMAKRVADCLTDENNATVPVCGIVHGDEQYAVMITATSGAEYGIVNASLANSLIPYNWSTICFEYRQMYSQPVSKTKSVSTLQKNPNNVSPKLSFYFLSGKNASYSGMALKYRSILENDGILTFKENASGNIPLRINIAASEIKDGLFFDTTVTLTTAQSAKDIIDFYNSMDINKITMIVEGWQKGGINGNKYGKLKTQNSVGTFKEWEKIKEIIENNEGNFYLQSNPIFINESQANLSKASNISASRNFSCYVRDNNKVMFNKKYVINPIEAVSFLDTLKTKMTGWDLNLVGISSELYSHHTQEGIVSRLRTRELFEKRAKALVDNETKLAMNTPNMYMWKYCEDYLDIPMMSSQYIYETDSVPFLQMLLKGCIDYYAPYANQGFYRNSCILKTIEYGAYPSFYFTASQNSEFLDTPLEDYFSLNYEDWKETSKELYSKINMALSKVENAYITEHKTIDVGIVRVSYSNGIKIYINYNSHDCLIENTEIPALNFCVKEGA